MKNGAQPNYVEAALSYALIPEPGRLLIDQYLATLETDREKETAKKIIADYSSQRLLTFRIKSFLHPKCAISNE